MKRISLALAFLLATATALVGQSFPIKTNAAGVVTEPAAVSLVNTTLTLPTSFTWAGTLAVANGGTGQSTWTLGDFLYANGTNTLAKLAGSTSATLAVLTQTGTGTVSAAPVWTSTTGTGNVVRATSPTLVTPTLGAATATSITGAASTDLALNGGSGTSNVVLTASGAGGNVYARPGASGYVRVDTGLGMRVEAGTLNVTTTTPSTTPSSGALVVGNGTSGGLGVGGAIYAAGGITSTTGSVAALTNSGGIYWGSTGNNRLIYNGSNTYQEIVGGLFFNNGIGGTTIASINSLGDVNALRDLSTTNGRGIITVTNSSAGASVQNYGLKVGATVSQSAAADFRDLLINRTNTTPGGGTQLLVDAQVGGVSQFSVNTAGAVTAPSLTAPATTALTLAGGSSGASLVLGVGGATTAATINVPATATGRVLIYNGNGGVGRTDLDFSNAAFSAANATTRIRNNITNSGSNGALSFWTSVSGIIAQNATLTDTGNLLIGTTTDMTGSGGLKVAGTTSATSSTAGAFLVGNGTAATNVAIGAGNINAGGSITAGNTLTVSTAAASLLVATGATEGDLILADSGAASGSQAWNLQSDGGVLSVRRLGDNFGTVSSTPLTISAAGTVNVTASTPSTTTTSGALQVAGGVGVIGAMNVGGGIGSYGASTSAGVFAFTSGSMTGTNMYGFTDQTATYTVSSPATEVMGHRVYSTLALGASGTLANWYGFSSTLSSKTGAAVLTNAYAFYANSPTQATNNYAFYSAGTAPSVFGGAIDLGATTTSANAVRWSTDTTLYRGAAGYLSMGTAAIGGGFSVQNSSAGGQITVQSAGTPMLNLTDTTQAVDAKIWSIRSSSSSLIVGAWPDNFAGISPAITIARSANVPSLVTITPPATFAGAVTAANSSGTSINVTTNQAPGTAGSPLNVDLNFKGYLDNTLARIRSWDESSSTGFGSLQFSTSTGGTLATAMTINQVGVVSIPASTPSTLTTNGALVVTGGVGIGGVVNASNYRATGANGGPATQTTILDHSSGDGRVIVYGPNTATAGSFSMIGLSSNGSVGGSRFTISSAGAATFGGSITGNSTLAIAGGASLAGAANSNGQFGSKTAGYSWYFGNFANAAGTAAGVSRTGEILLSWSDASNVATFTGGIVAGGAGVSFGGNVFNLDTTTNGAATTYFNNTGYAGGGTQFRSTIFQNGKGASILTLDAPTSASTFTGAVTAPSLTAPAALTLAGGTSGASLVLGQGTTAGTVTITPTGLAATTTLAGFVAAGTLNSGNVNSADTTTTLRTRGNITVDGTGRNANGADAFLNAFHADSGSVNGFVGSLITSFANGANFASATYFKTRNGAGQATEVGRFTGTGNLLIGTTTDITGTGGLRVAGTTPATSYVTGALQSWGGVGVNGAVWADGTAGNTLTGSGLVVRGGNTTFSTNIAEFRTFGGTTATTAIAGDGSIRAFANVASTNTTTGSIVVGGGVGVGGAGFFGGTVNATQNVFIGGAAGTFRSTQYTTAGVNRWGIGATNAAESGSNAGSDLLFNRWNDAGGDLGAALTLTRSTGAATFAGQGNFQATSPQIVIGAGATAINQIGFIYSSGGQYFGLAGNRNPNSGVFVNTAGTHASVDLDTGAAGSSITFRTTATPNTLGNVALTLAPTGAAAFAGAVTANGQLIGKGTATNDSAATGYIGEYVSSLVATGSAVALTASGTAYNVTSISLTAGDWDVETNASYNMTGTTGTLKFAGVSTTSATFGGPETYALKLNTTTTTTNTDGLVSPLVRVSLSATTTVYMVARHDFSAGTVSAFGSIRARRVR